MTLASVEPPAEPLISAGGQSTDIRFPRSDGPSTEAELANANRAATEFAQRWLTEILGDAARWVAPQSAPQAPATAPFPVRWWDDHQVPAKVLRSIESQSAGADDLKRIRLVRGGGFTPVDSGLYTTTDGSHLEFDAERLNTGAVAALIADGAVVNLNYLEDTDVVMRRFAEYLGSISRASTNINAYVSRGGPSGTGGHWDNHDVILVQLTGEKRWLIRQPTDVNPVSNSPMNLDAGEIVADGLLTAGTALYVPRGYWHEGTSNGSLSIHLTIGLNRPTPLTAAAMFDSSLHHLADHRRDLRPDDRSLPTTLSLPTGEDFVELFWATLAAHRAAAASTLLDVASNLWALENWTGLGLVARIPCSGGLAMIDRDENAVTVLVGGKKVVCQPATAHVIAQLASGATTPIDGLAASSGLDADDLTNRLKELLAHGLLDIYTGSEADRSMVDVPGSARVVNEAGTAAQLEVP